ncbi:MAG: helicase-related protein [Candidatus Phytoplasma stylosanthis]|uniref:DEAD/DEAH box helicase n=1 Tax=Candidatus Phytoplasma stylosanthis TaxID=2798314 RepID=UPI00293B613D|nr:DEAD/DEAH box helicase [Candidatus Phytoplasma stylosanthis]MDV3168055.1 helicase-related protein [Candidatus Phytoplasma stylosanthis]MDV3170997.1 helicase-related protein [Candidatus Phytoplasma stylosanthis]MDV3173714.1 helicase-related protein [Candidatus Phytoplasma stylosanthis]MDV3174313.1 helicase-related protein [Candidatus Phytoplasma stylosanthis]MDV3202497.1 helicase-related protein [Candidatus Phytoplasma stylosanthis]
MKINQKIFVKGTYYQKYNSIFASFISKANIKENIRPIYKLKNISDISIQDLIEKIFEHPQFKIKENLDERILKKYNLITRTEAFRNLHLPENQNMLDQTIKRFKYEEAFFIIKKWQKNKKYLTFKNPLKYDIHYVKEMIKNVPFTLTEEQKKIVNNIYSDFKKNYSTQRLIQGDVGSGKTIIVFIAALGIINLNKQVLMMAPTKILAQQHYLNFKKIFPQIETVYINSKTTQKENIKKLIQNNHYKMIFGTHGLTNIDFKQLGLIIIDETHKFGQDIKNKTIAKNMQADVIYLTATPIPKTLSTIYFGLLRVSILNNKYHKENNIITQKTSFENMLSLLKQNQNRNEQTYIVVPAIKDNKKDFNIENINIFLKKRNVTNVYILHSEQKKETQEEAMNRFINDKKGILLATSIIEVGIDVANATTIIILGAEYFGLSQLHQLRGRVGRNNKKNYCFLIYSKENKRLNFLQKENNGFNLSKLDFKKRGPGDFLGSKQSGFFKYNFLNISEDLPIIYQIQKDFKDLLN